MELRPHQIEAIGKIKNGSVLAGGVGVGKTITALAYYSQIVCKGHLDRSEPMLEPRDLYVFTTARKRDDLDWYSEGLHLGLFKEPENSYSGKKFVVESWQNITKFKDIEGAFIIFDEQRLVGSGAWVKAFLKMVKRNQWIMLSATPGDSWKDYAPLFVAHGFYHSRSEFLEEHAVWQLVGGKYRVIRKYMGERKLRALREKILVDMPMERHTKRHLITEVCSHDEAAFNRVWRRRWNIYTDMPLADSAEMYRVARRLVNSDPSRLDAIDRITALSDRIIVFYNFDYELEILRTLHTRLDIPVFEWNGHRHDPVPSGDRWIYLVQYVAGAEAWNCITTDTVVYYSLTYSYKVFEQTQGRIDRLNTPYTDLYYYILVSDSKVDQLIFGSLEGKKDFSEGRNFKFAEKMAV